jgi:hypothetical protein
MRLVALLLVVRLDEVDHPVLPRRGVAPLGRVAQPQLIGERLVDGPAARRLVGDLVEDVGQVVDRVNDLADVRLLERLDARVEREDLVVVDRGDPDPVDVVGSVERMAPDVVGRRCEVEAEALEEHHRDVDALFAGRDDAIAEPVEVGLVEPREVELRLAVPGHARPGPRPRLRRHTEMDVDGGQPALELLPAPQPDELLSAMCGFLPSSVCSPA